MRTFRLSLAVAACLLATVLLTPARCPAGTEPLSVVEVTPSGENVDTGIEEIAVSFSRLVAPRSWREKTPERVPVVIEPPVECRWYWKGPQTLACRLFGQELLPATRYTVTVLPGIRGEYGTTLKRRYVHTFATQGPSARRVALTGWMGPGVPWFRLSFNQPVSKKSVEDHVYFRHAGEARIPAVVKESPGDTEPPVVFQRTGDFVIVRESGAVSVGEKAPGVGLARKTWRVRPVERLPRSTVVELFVEPGLSNPHSTGTGTQNRVLGSVDTCEGPAFVEENL
ncbi:MAG: Ig-like domain-containing protein, partial [Desulfatibacillaceae bacterium]